METKAKNEPLALGVNELEVKKQKVSPSYTVRQYGLMIAKLKDMEMIDEKDEKTLKEIGQKIVNRFLGLDMFK